MFSEMCLRSVGFGIFTLLLSQAHAPLSAAEGAIEINQVSALAGIGPGDGPGFPITINQPGRYVLTGSIEATADADGIWVNVADVTLDLRGFTVSSAGGSSGMGIYVDSGASNFEVRNGTVRDFPSFGIVTDSSATRTRVIDVRAQDNGNTGLMIQAASSLVRGCTVSGNSGDGIRGFPGSLIIDNVVHGNTGVGLLLNNVAYGRNILYANNGGNANPQVNANLSMQVDVNQCGDGICP